MDLAAGSIANAAGMTEVAELQSFQASLATSSADAAGEKPAPAVLLLRNDRRPSDGGPGSVVDESRPFMESIRMLMVSLRRSRPA